MPTVLNLGCGPKGDAPLPALFDGWAEIRVDSEPAVDPDYVGSMVDLRMIDDAAVDAVFCSHSLEHLPLHQVQTALGEIRRVLRGDGIFVAVVPNLEGCARAILADRLHLVVAESPAGPITPHDMIYGLTAALAAGHDGMAHRCGFTPTMLQAELERAFPEVAVRRRDERNEIVGVARKTKGQGIDPELDALVPRTDPTWRFEAKHPQAVLFDRLSQTAEGCSADDVIGAAVNLLINGLKIRHGAKALVVYDQLMMGQRERLQNEFEPAASALIN
jgi:SAM-dependent methyltransferase